ncbi:MULTISPECIES: TfoX/Sxy family protein [unclassified Rathayibacter]|uniref:TfoX/Sxy family protein n=1 Tax=unclassified Rathayibacter TaxID=2609250 RepID=UPI002B265BAF|nr:MULTISPECIES: TfoX/Sxy family protein [unclassified Rathayibacter]
MTTPTLAAQSGLAERLRALFATRPHQVRETRMFGTLAFMVDDAMAVAARRDGGLLVRVDPARYDELLEAGGAPALMGPNRSMGRGWLTVEAAQLASDDELERWVDIGIEARPKEGDAR